jgi:hypothetical protein
MNSSLVFQVLAILISGGALVITMINIWNRSQIRLELAKQQSDFLMKLFYEVREENKTLRDKLEKLDEQVHSRVDEHEKDVVHRLEEMQKLMHQMDIKITKLVN